MITGWSGTARLINVTFASTGIISLAHLILKKERGWLYLSFPKCAQMKPVSLLPVFLFGVFLSRVNSLNTARLNTTKSTMDTVNTSTGHGGDPTEGAKACRSGSIKLPGRQKSPPLCGNSNHDDDRCLFSCIAGGFYHGVCTKSDECFCYRNNPQKGFIIEKRTPIMRRVKTREPIDVEADGDDGALKEITFVTDDYTTGYVDVDVNVNLEWDLSYLSEWFQSFNFYNNLQCDPCLCPAGCAIYGYFSGYCTPQPTSECMCATAAKRPL